MVAPVGQSHRLELGARARRPLLGWDPAVEQRQLDVLEGRRPREEIERLEDESNLLVSDPGEGVRTQVRDIGPVEDITPGARRVEAAEEVHEGGLARARRTHDGDELAGRDDDGDAAQRVDLAGSERVVLHDALCLDERRRHH